MRRSRSSRHKTQGSREQGVWARLPLRQMAMVGGASILIGAVLFLKLRQSPSASAERVATDPTVLPEQAIPTVSASGSPTAADWATREAASTGASSATEALLPERQLDRGLEAGEPMVLFFRSNSCVQCVKMAAVVEEVYPDFSDSVVLIDVDVYDAGNRSLLQRAGIRAIPTLVFVDGGGGAQAHVGVMEANTLREQLREMVGD